MRKFLKTIIKGTLFCLLLLAASVIGRAVINRFTQLQQTHAGSGYA